MTLENSEETLSKYFSSVEEHPYEDTLRFESADPFMLFYATGHRFCGAKAKAPEYDIPESTFDELYAEVEKTVEKHIAENGYFEVSKQNSVFICS